MLRQTRLVLGFCGTLIFAYGSALAGSSWLITPEEASLVAQQEGSLEAPVSAKEGPGPLIVVKQPKALQRLKSPVDIFIAFEPGESGLAADMGSLNVKFVGFIDIDITNRLEKYIKGQNLVVEQANLPSGRHRLRMAIKDVEGNQNERDVVVVVSSQ